jgi:V8-like Glu-specific endopeptidase
MKTFLLYGAVLMMAVPAYPAEAQQTPAAAVTGALESVCHLSTTRKRGVSSTNYNSSGVLYRGRYIITAAHNLHSTLLSTLTRIAVSCGRVNPSDAEHIVVPIAQTRVAKGYRWFPKRYDRDFAIIKLPAAINVAQPFELSTTPIITSEGGVQLAGFPGGSVAAGMSGQRMFSGATAGTPEGAFLKYDLDTFTGNSGGPVWRMAQGRPQLLGIHISGDAQGGRARIVDSDFRAEVDRLIASMQ